MCTQRQQSLQQLLDLLPTKATFQGLGSNTPTVSIVVVPFLGYPNFMVRIP